MNVTSNYNIITSFPDFSVQGFDMNAYNNQFKSANVIIHAKSKNISYPTHWGPLSIKCAFKGKEHYELNNCLYAVGDENYLVINEGSNYSSFIDSMHEVNSFTVNFSPLFVNALLENAMETDDNILSNFGNSHAEIIVDFFEKIYSHDHSVSPLLFQLSAVSKDVFLKNSTQIEELYFLLFDRLLLKHRANISETLKIAAKKKSTQIELYKRLHRAKDFIDSSFTKDLNLDDLANVSWLNKSYLLRQFKKYFKTTPRQYIISKRMVLAKQLLQKKEKHPISDVCFLVGYSDHSSFSRLFTKYCNCSPETYQNRL